MGYLFPSDCFNLEPDRAIASDPCLMVRSGCCAPGRKRGFGSRNRFGSPPNPCFQKHSAKGFPRRSSSGGARLRASWIVSTVGSRTKRRHCAECAWARSWALLGKNSPILRIRLRHNVEHHAPLNNQPIVLVVQWGGGTLQPTESHGTAGCRSRLKSPPAPRLLVRYVSWFCRTTLPQ